MGKCNYCNVDELTHETKRKIRKNQNMKIVLGTNFFNKNIYYLEIIPERANKEIIDIKYCPFCGRKLGETK